MVLLAISWLIFASGRNIANLYAGLECYCSTELYNICCCSEAAFELFGSSSTQVAAGDSHTLVLLKQVVNIRWTP